MEPKTSYGTAIRERFCEEPPFGDVLLGLARRNNIRVTQQETALPAFTFAAFEPVRDEPQPATTLRRSLHDSEPQSEPLDRLSALVAWWSKHRDAFREAWSEMIGLKQEDDTYPANSVEAQLRVLEEALSKAKVPPTINL